MTKSNKALRDLIMDKKNGVWNVLDRKSMELEGTKDGEKSKKDLDNLKNKFLVYS